MAILLFAQKNGLHLKNGRSSFISNETIKIS